MARVSAAELIPANFTWQVLHDTAAGCRACPLWERGTQTVLGEGPEGARVLIVGEQPGNEEDRAGLPFVGPAGRLLDEALAEAGVDRTVTYVTNVVKHFKWEERGKRRIHAKPIAACVPWLTADRGKWIESTLAPFVMATVHPSSILRARDSETRRAETARFIQDLRLIPEALQLHTRKAR